MRKSIIEYTDMGKLLIPRELADEVRALHRDPVTGRVRYGDLKTLWIQLISNYVDSRRDTAALIEPRELFGE